MSDNEQPNESVNTAKKALNDGLASAMQLKNNNPKVFFGGLGLLLVFVLFLTLSGGDDSAVGVAGKQAKNLAIGQKYILKSPNSYDEKATVQLVPVPGTIAAYDDGATDEDGKNPCKSILQGTHVSIMAFQDAYGKKNSFSQVKIEEGPCKDKDGWVLSVDLE